MHDFLQRLLDQPAWLVYLAVGLIVFAEDALFVGFVIPGETAAILGGVSASMHHTELGWMLALVAVAAIVGDTVGYEVGRHLGPRILAHRSLNKHGDRIEKAQSFLRRRGGSAVFLGRWTAFFRAVMPALAGTAQMRYRTFLAWNALGGISWAIVAVTAGYLAGASYQRVAKWLGTGSAIIVVAIVVIAFLVWHFRRRAAERADDAARVG